MRFKHLLIFCVASYSGGAFFSPLQMHPAVSANNKCIGAISPMFADSFATQVFFTENKPSLRTVKPDISKTPLLQAHAHNDYEHERPLFDALDQGFTHIEVDVHLMGDELFVSHMPPLLLSNDKTLRALYLEPLDLFVRLNGGSVFPSGDLPLHLMIDIKTDAAATYEALKSYLQPYQHLLTSFENGMKASDSTWKVIGNQVLFAEFSVMPVLSKIFVNFDAWDGYPMERQAIKDLLFKENINNVIFATGDTHSAWCFDIPLDYKQYKKKKAGKIVAYEFATPSITSANFDEYKSKKTVDFMEKTFASDKVNPHLRYLDLSNHGYLLLSLTPYDAVAEWRFVESIRQRTNGEFVGEKRVVKATGYPSLYKETVTANNNAATGSSSK